MALSKWFLNPFVSCSFFPCIPHKNENKAKVFGFDIVLFCNILLHKYFRGIFIIFQMNPP